MLLLVVVILTAALSASHGQIDVFKQRVYVGQSVKLKCGPISRFINIPMKFQWEKPLGTVIGTQPELSLSTVNFADGGTYTCRVTHRINNKLEEKVLSTQLLIDKRDSEDNEGGSTLDFPSEPPTIVFKGVTSDRFELTETQYLYVECQIPNWNANEYTVRWTRNSQTIPGTTQTLFLSPLNAGRDSGSYRCEVRHNAAPTQVYQRQFYVNIIKPTIEMLALPGEDLRIGGRIYRQCSVKGQDKLQFSWVKDNGATVATGSVLDLRINDFGVNGRYTCVVTTSSGGLKYENNFSVRIDSGGPGGPDPIPRGPPTVKIFSKPLSPEVKKTFELKCQIEPPQPGAIFVWKKNGQEISRSRDYSIPVFQKTDTGVYTCEVILLNGRVIGSGASNPKKSIDVQFQFTTSRKIELEAKGSQLIAKVGEKRELHCEIKPTTRSRGSDVSWYFQGQLLNSQTLNRYNIYRDNRLFVSILTLKRIDLSNEGQYMCMVNNLQKKANLIVIQDKSSLTVNPEKLVINEGEAAEFHCRVNNMPNVINNQLVWKFQSRDTTRGVTDISRRWEMNNNVNTPETSFLSLTNTLTSDSGFYICNAPTGELKTVELVVNSKKEPITVIITPSQVRVRPGQPITLDCFSQSRITGQPVGPPPEFVTQNGRSLQGDLRFTRRPSGPSRTSLSVSSGLRTADSNMRIECRSGDQSATAIIYLEEPACPPSYRRCAGAGSGRCLPPSAFCNGRTDCPDGSDELPNFCNKCDPLTKKCEFYNGIQPLKPTFLIHWECDGENDCGNNFDESKCAEESRTCGGLKFSCLNGKTIPNAYRCDKEADCLTNEDETGCVAPQVTTALPGASRVIRVRRGGSVSIRCEALGQPIPRVAWRFNWGCLPDRISGNGQGSRMTVIRSVDNCRREISELRISNFQFGDDGIYNCEALSIRNRAFSEDYQLILEMN